MLLEETLHHVEILALRASVHVASFSTVTLMRSKRLQQQAAVQRKVPSIFFPNTPPSELKIHQLFREALFFLFPGLGENVHCIFLSPKGHDVNWHRPCSDVLMSNKKEVDGKAQMAVSITQRQLSRYCCHRDKTHLQRFSPSACKHFISALQQHSCPKNNAMWARALRWHCRQQTVFCSGFMNHHYRCHMISNSSYSAQTCSHAFAPTCKQRGWHHVIAQPTFILILYPNSEIGSWYGWWGQ